MADSWSRSFTPTRENYLKNYYGYVRFLDKLSGKRTPVLIAKQKMNDDLKKEITLEFKKPSNRY